MNGMGQSNLSPRLVAPRTLIADDQPDVLVALRLLLKREGFQIEAVTSPWAAIEAVRTRPFDLVLMDLNYARDTTSGREGLNLLSQIRAVDRTLPVVVMTAWSSVELAVEAMREGSGDFIQKPWDNSELLAVLRRQLSIGESLRREASLVEIRERENREAREIQHRLLPRSIPQIAGCEIATWWQPAREVGGDYFDVWQLDEHHLAFCIADVVGKGMPAALLMANLQAAVRSLACPNLSPAELCAQVNRLICSNVDVGKFITFFYGVLNIGTRQLNYVNAGHCAPLLAKNNGSALSLTEGGVALGIVPSCQYSTGWVGLESGDRLALFTDGVTEARNAMDEEFGDERLLHLLESARPLGAAELQRTITNSIFEFSEGELGDDATMLLLAIG